MALGYGEEVNSFMTKPKTTPHLTAGRKKTKNFPIDKVCAHCGETFRAETVYAIHKQTFCSHTCRAAVKGNGRNLPPPVLRCCKQCGKEMWLRPYQLATKNFCSYGCANSFNNAGDRNAAWRGGNDKYWKHKARERDDFTCQFPGCSFRNEGAATHAHHKFPRAAGGTDSLDNLITFCGKHHGMVEAMFLRRLNELHPGIVEAVVTELYADLEKGMVGPPLQAARTILRPTK